MQALTEYWNNLPEEHKDTLFSMREEDFVAELDAHMKYQLKVQSRSPVLPMPKNPGMAIILQQHVVLTILP